MEDQEKIKVALKQINLLMFLTIIINIILSILSFLINCFLY